MCGGVRRQMRRGTTIPYVDLLNHSPRGSAERATTLRRDANGSFFMVAERDIAAGEEISHSYGPSGTTATTDDDDDGAEGSGRGASSARDDHLSLLPLDTFLVAWLYGSRKHQTQRQKKEFSKPYESGGKPNPSQASL